MCLPDAPIISTSDSVCCCYPTYTPTSDALSYVCDRKCCKCFTPPYCIHNRYGAFYLALEIMGATAMLPYALCNVHGWHPRFPRSTGLPAAQSPFDKPDYR
jgi:hypothetical protein